MKINKWAMMFGLILVGHVLYSLVTGNAMDGFTSIIYGVACAGVSIIFGED